MPFDLRRDEINAALDEVQWEGLKYYSAHCPRCRKANKLSKKQLRMWAPMWKPSPRPKVMATAKTAITKSAKAKTSKAKTKTTSKAKTKSKPKAKAKTKAKPKTKTKAKAKTKK
jgi:hypothetical protein